MRHLLLKGHETIMNSPHECKMGFHDRPVSNDSAVLPRNRWAFSGEYVLAGCGTRRNEDAEPTSTPTETVIVAPDAKPVFRPEELTIRPDTTVKWVWQSSNHNIVGSQPESASWRGTHGARARVSDVDYIYLHPFDVAGRYHY